LASAHSDAKPFETIKLAYGEQVLWPDHCVQGTSSAEISKDISIPQAELIVWKGYHNDMDSYSAFLEADHKTPTGLGGYLTQRGINKAFVTGPRDLCDRRRLPPYRHRWLTRGGMGRDGQSWC